jgi:L-ascorbate metabolism protein UlaG (beta-lactamase superfamily)
MNKGWVVPESRTKPVLSGIELRNQMRRTIPERGEIAIWWLTQASYLVKFRTGPTILIDPWWRDLDAGDQWGKLLGEFPLEPEEHPQPDYVFCTHWHDDHICPESLPRLAAAFPRTKFIVPRRSRELLIECGIPAGRIRAMRGDDSGTLNGGLTFFTIPAAHTELDKDVHSCYLYLGYLIRCDGFTLFHMGDGQPYAGWNDRIIQSARLLYGEYIDEPPIDLALLCINGNDNLSASQAVHMAGQLGVNAVLPMHYGMDPGNTVDPRLFGEEMDVRQPDIPYVLPKAGQRMLVRDGQIREE